MKKIILLSATVFSFSLSLSASEVELKQSAQDICFAKNHATFCAAQKVGALALACINEQHPNIAIEDFRKHAPIELSRTTKQGLLLELVDQNIYCLWTPWGRWSLTSYNDAHKKTYSDATRALFKKIQTIIPYTLKEHRSYDQYGARYQVLAVDDISLPTPVVLTFHEAMSDYINSKKRTCSTWHEMSEYFTKEQEERQPSSAKASSLAEATADITADTKKEADHVIS